MRKFGLRGSAVLLLAGTVGTIAAAQSPGGSGKYTPAPTAATSSLWSDWFGGKPSKPKPDEGKGAAAQPAPVLTPADKERELARYNNAYFRRMDVCLKLRELADQTNDLRLLEEVNRLEELAAQVRNQQADRLIRGQTLESGAASATTTLSGEGRGAGDPAARTASTREGKR